MIRIILTIGLFLPVLTNTFGQIRNFIDQPYIEVSGYADTLVTPNQIFIKIITSEKDTKDKISIEEQESKMIAAFKNMGINTELDLTSSDMISNYRIYLLKQKDILKTKEYILKVTTAELASKVFIQLEELGISNTSIHKVDHSNKEALKNYCQTKAIVNAQKQAIALAKAISQTIGNAIYIANNEADLENALQGRAAGIQVRGYSSYDKAKYEAPKIEFEKIKISAAVSAKFILK